MSSSPVSSLMRFDRSKNSDEFLSGLISDEIRQIEEL
jgi:hypothetical protein